MRAILLIDADLGHSQKLAAYLRTRSCKVTICANLSDGLALAATLVPDLIVLDQFSSEQSGLDALRHLSRSNATRDIPILMIASNEHGATKIRALWQGAQDYLVKPVDPALLWRIASIHLDDSLLGVESQG